MRKKNTQGCVTQSCVSKNKYLYNIYDLGSPSNITRLKNALIEREIVELREGGYYIADPLFKIWFKRER